MLVLEPLERARARGAAVYCEVAGAAIGCDAFHITSPEPTGAGAERAIRQALVHAGVDAAEVDCIIAHGTGTKLNDAAEAGAIARVFDGRGVAVTAPKSIVGHTLGAAGAFGVAVGALAVRARDDPALDQLRHARPRLPARHRPRRAAAGRAAGGDRERVRVRRPERRRRAAGGAADDGPGVLVLADLDAGRAGAPRQPRGGPARTTPPRRCGPCWSGSAATATRRCWRSCATSTASS